VQNGRIEPHGPSGKSYGIHSMEKSVQLELNPSTLRGTNAVSVPLQWLR
jgi:hypothetical protein